MLDNSLKPLLRLKFPPAQPAACTPMSTLVSPIGTSVEINRGQAPTPPPASRAQPLPMTPPKRVKPSRLRSRAKRREGWIDQIIKMFAGDGAEREPLMAFGAAHRDIVRAAFDRHLKKADAVSKLVAAWSDPEKPA